VETGDEIAYRVLALREKRNIQNAVFCEGSFVKNHALYVHLTYKDVDCFRKGSVYELYCFKACQISKVHAHSHKITNKLCASSNHENTDKNYGY